MLDHKFDERWFPYVNKVKNVSTAYYLSVLEYPEDVASAQKILAVLNLDLNSIKAQIQKYTEGKTISDYSWVTKVENARKMKCAQIEILECWIAENSKEPITTELFEESSDRLTLLEKRVEELEEAFKSLQTERKLENKSYRF